MVAGYLYIRPDLKTIGDFHRKRRSRRPGVADEWHLIAEDVEMQLRSRRPAASSARPEIDFNDISASESQWYWARVRPVLALRNGYRLTRKQAGGQPFDTDNSGESIFLYIIQNDVFGEVQHLLLTDVDRGL